ncbi:MAG TPA: RNA polymerase sigma factor [Capillimicrobium sp.]|nr:RNA polymerase sigma factor [Capillimicrobium sp.]
MGQPPHRPPGSGRRPGDLRRIATDPDAFEAFYREHVEAVQRFIARRVGDRERVADLTAEVFLAAIASASGYRRGRGTPAAWLFGVARNVVADDRRREGRERRATGEIVGRRLLAEDDLARMDERLDAAAQSRRLYEAMDRLSERERAVLELVALDDLSVIEAAAVLGIRPVAARVRLHRARRALRERLEARPGDEIPTPSTALEVAP